MTEAEVFRKIDEECATWAAFVGQWQPEDGIASLAHAVGRCRPLVAMKIERPGMSTDALELAVDAEMRRVVPTLFGKPTDEDYSQTVWAIDSEGNALYGAMGEHVGKYGDGQIMSTSRG